MPAPTLDPGYRSTAEISPTDSYSPADPVWIYRGGSWRPGIIETASSRAATVTYRPNTTRGTGVDTLTARYITRRTDFDEVLDIGTDRLRRTRGGTERPTDQVPNGSAPDPLRR